ncbi:hypothetical protein [Kitasatospora sp. NPDC088134]|uniref:hypothetical protein n=1 Tax=Kitasatospora sp. NPDC088134 TaxID=3364071 RepID=UPI0037F1E97D
MSCDVCGRAMERWDVPPGRWWRECWECGWCRAKVTRHGPGLTVSRQPYVPWDLRWERACSDLLPDAGRHAYSGRGRTLCGIERPDLAGSPYGGWGYDAEECPDCRSEALAVDARWPAELRKGYGDLLAPPPEPDPLDDPDRVVPPDELGRPDLVLPAVAWSPRTRVLETRPTGRNGPDDGYRWIGDGPSALRLPARWFCYAGVPYPPADPWAHDPEDGFGRSFDLLPPLDEDSFTGDWSWFRETDGRGGRGGTDGADGADGTGGIGEPLEHRTAVTDRIAAALAPDGLALPADFVALITRSRLHRCLDRAGGDRTDVTGPLPSPLHPDDRLVPFLREGQSLYLQYLYLHRDGSSAVVGSTRDLTEEPVERYGPDGELVSVGPAELFWCAPSTEVFAYRYLAEETLRTAARERRRAGELDPEHLAHLAHYLRP